MGFMEKSIFILIAVLILSVLLAGCSSGAQPPGILEGQVTIGPLTPVQKPGPPPPVPPEVYQARKIMVYDNSGKKLIQKIDIDNNGRYRVEVLPGTYVVDINRIGIDHSKDLPKTVEIKSGQTVTLNIDIDTGIR